MYILNKPNTTTLFEGFRGKLKIPLESVLIKKDLFRQPARTNPEFAVWLIADGGWVDVDIKRSVLYLYTAYLSLRRRASLPTFN